MSITLVKHNYTEGLPEMRNDAMQKNGAPRTNAITGIVSDEIRDANLALAQLIPALYRNTAGAITSKQTA